MDEQASGNQDSLLDSQDQHEFLSSASTSLLFHLLISLVPRACVNVVEEGEGREWALVLNEIAVPPS